MRKELLTSMLLLAGVLAGCSSDSPVPVEQQGDGTTAYLNVAIAMAQSSTSRGEVDENQLYSDGLDEEYAVNNATFYFYDSKGNFVAEAKGFGDGSNVTSDANVDYRSETMIILTNLDSENMPAYMVTVLNRPSDFSGSLLPMNQILNQITYDYKTSDGNFVMTTSSYKHELEDVPYYVTKLSSDMFYQTLAAATATGAKSVDIYVERLAAKVQVELSSSLISSSNTKVITAADGSKRYIHKVSGINVDGKNQLQDFYVELLSWGLDGQMQVSYMLKHINEDWTNSELGFTWNSTADHRSYWGMSYNYSTQKHDYEYPSKYEDDILGVDSDYQITELKYIKATEAVYPFTGKNYTYCMENTNTADLIKTYYPSCLTSVIVLAKIVDENGKNIDETLINYMNTFYTKSGYIQAAIDQMSRENRLPSKLETRAVDLDIDDFTLVDCGNGEVFIALSKSGEASLAAGDKNTIDEINAYLKKFNETSVAVTYNDGYMYYNIPIQHRNGNGASSKDDVQEATYGVVRNHLYQVNINSVTNLGKGINDTEEPIVVSDKDQKYYYIGANVNILSWARVSQNSDL